MAYNSAKVRNLLFETTRSFQKDLNDFLILSNTDFKFISPISEAKLFRTSFIQVNLELPPSESITSACAKQSFINDLDFRLSLI